MTKKEYKATIEAQKKRIAELEAKTIDKEELELKKTLEENEAKILELEQKEKQLQEAKTKAEEEKATSELEAKKKLDEIHNKIISTPTPSTKEVDEKRLEEIRELARKRIKGL